MAVISSKDPQKDPQHLLVACPYCHQPAGLPCVWTKDLTIGDHTYKKGDVKTTFHVTRSGALHTALKANPNLDQEETMMTKALTTLVQGMATSVKELLMSDEKGPPLPPGLLGGEVDSVEPLVVEWKTTGPPGPSTITSAAEAGADKGPYLYSCPTCHQQPGRKCRVNGKIVKPHNQRLLAAGLLKQTPIQYPTCSNCGKPGTLVLVIESQKVRRLIGITKSPGSVEPDDPSYKEVYGPILHTMNHTRWMRCEACGYTTGQSTTGIVDTNLDKDLPLLPPMVICNSEDDLAAWPLLSSMAEDL